MAHTYYCEDMNRQDHRSTRSSTPQGANYARPTNPSGQYFASTIKAKLPWS